MAVARMLKVHVIGVRPVMDKVIDRLQRDGVLGIAASDVTEGAEAEVEGVRPVHIPAGDQRLSRLQEYSADAHFVLGFLGTYHRSEAPLSSFISEKVHMAESDFHSLKVDRKFQRLYRECVALADRLAHIERERTRLRALVHDLAPWRDLHLQVSHWRGTDNTVLCTGTVPATRGQAIRQSLREAVTEVTVEELGPSGNRQAWVVIAHRSVCNEVRSVLALADFEEVSFPDLEDYPAEEISLAEAQLAEYAEEEARLRERAAELSAKRYHTVLALSEALSTELEALRVREHFGRTEHTFVVTGWVPAANEGTLRDSLASLAGDVDVDFLKPAEGDSPPVELENPRFLRPFELLTDLYGRPRYDELDPTPLLAPFFLLFFGICISDVGYGAMLGTGAYLIKTRLDVAPGVRRFMDLLIHGAVMSMILGVLFGSWFALPIDDPWPALDGVRRAMASVQVLNPMDDILYLLGGCVALGVIQVFFGVGLAAYDSFRRGDAATAVFEKVSIVFLFAAIGGAVAATAGGHAAIGRALLVAGVGGTILMQGRALEAALRAEGSPAWDRAAGWLWLAGTLAALGVIAAGSTGTGLGVLAGASLLALVSRTGRKSVLAMLGGVYAVYGMSSFVGDILSYTRLAALGLSGALVGLVFNILSGMVWGSAAGLFERGGVSIAAGVAVVLLAALVFAAGHTFNVVINLLGAFVHPARLQFVEFFSKFYQGGGQPFSPFAVRTKTLVLHAGETRQEGGT